MARRNNKGQFVKGGRRARGRRRVSSGAITVVQAAPVKRRSGTRTRVVKVRAKRRSSSGGSTLGGLGRLIGGGHRVPVLIGAGALGFAHQQKWLEKLPVVGKAGPVTSFGLLGWGAEEILKIKVPGIVHDAITAALAISAFNIGFTAGSPGGVNVVGSEYPGGAAFYEE